MKRAFLGLALLLGSASPAAAAWSEARTKHFIIYSEQRPAALKAYAERLERFDAAVRAVRGMEDPALTDGGKVTIYVLPTVAAFQRLAGMGNTVLGFYSGRAEGSVAFLSSRGEGDGLNGLTSDHVFQHEYMHHLMLGDAKTPLAPWLIEGTAEFFGTAQIEKDGSVKIGDPPQVRGWAVLEDMGFNAQQLLASQPAKTAEESESVYGKGWLLTHYLAFNKARSGQLTKYLMGMNGGVAPLAAAQSAFGDLKLLDKELDRYAGTRFTALKISPSALPSVTIRPMSAGAAAIMQVRLKSERGTNKDTAPPIAAEARRIAANYPTDVFVQGTLAEAEFDTKDYKAALAAAERALAVDPNNVQALVYKGRALMESAATGPAKADWPTIRRTFVQANKADLENAEPLWLFYQSFGRAGEQPSKSAVEGLMYAHALVPQDRSLRLAVVHRLLVNKQPQQAARAFAPLVFDPHARLSAQPMLQSALQKMKAGDSEGALKELEKDEDAPAPKAKS